MHSECGYVLKERGRQAVRKVKWRHSNKGIKVKDSATVCVSGCA